MTPLRCHLICLSNSPLLSQLYTGFILCRIGQVSRMSEECAEACLSGIFSTSPNSSATQHAHLRVVVNDRLAIHYDVHDGADIDEPAAAEIQFFYEGGAMLNPGPSREPPRQGLPARPQLRGLSRTDRSVGCTGRRSSASASPAAARSGWQACEPASPRTCTQSGAANRGPLGAFTWRLLGPSGAFGHRPRPHLRPARRHRQSVWRPPGGTGWRLAAGPAATPKSGFCRL